MASNAGPQGRARHYERLLMADPCNLEALVGLGRLALQAGRAREAVPYLSRAATLRPGDSALAKLLGLAWASSGDLAAAAESFARAVELAPGDPEAHGNLGNAQKRLGRPGEARACYETALALRPSSVELRVNLAGVLIESQCFDAAAAVCREALGLGRDPALLSKLVTLLLEAGDAAGALQACQRLKTLQPGWAGVLAHEGLALWQLGRDDAARRLFDYERLVRSLPLAVPPGHASLAAFNAALSEAVTAHGSLRYAPRGKATHGGSQSGELLDGSPLFAAFEGALRDGIARYVAALPQDPTHPFLARRLRRFSLTAWGVVLDSGGHQHPHVHPSGWLSGVYYVAVPPSVTEPEEAGGDPQAGWLEFGPADPRYRLSRPVECHAVPPQEGRMVIFPSYIWHGTRRFADPVQRISIAFDVWGEG